MLTETILTEFNTSTLIEHSNVTIPLLVQKKEKRISTTSKTRLEIVGSDKYGSLIIIFWDNIDQIDQKVKEGHIYNFSGVVKEYNGRIDMSGKYSQEIIGNKHEYVPRYEITSEQFKTFDAMYGYLPTENQKLVSFLTGYKKDIELWNKFVRAPLTERNSYNKLGGLFLHTLNTTKLLSKIMKNYPRAESINIKRLTTKSLLHDIAKIDRFIIDENTAVVKKIETNIEDNILSAMAILKTNDGLNLFNKEEIDNISYGVMSHKGEFGTVPIKSLEDKILYYANMMDMEIESNKIFIK